MPVAGAIVTVSIDGLGATKPTKGSKERRLTGKRERSQVKSTRASRGWERE